MLNENLFFDIKSTLFLITAYCQYLVVGMQLVKRRDSCWKGSRARRL